MKKLLTILAFIAAVVAANWLTATFGLVAVGFGLVVTAGTFAAGFALLARDAVSEIGGRKLSIACVLVGALLSWWLSTPALALASGAAFLVSEMFDLFVYTRLRRRGFTTAALGSNLLSTPVDTLVFLALAGFPLAMSVFMGQLVGKFVWATLLPVALYLGSRAVLRKPQHAINP
jgi:uncharacterized PurR-regulated membrane protein YhhQ (DUF165 family)